MEIKIGALQTGSGSLTDCPESSLYKDLGGDWTGLSNGAQTLFELPAGYFYMPICSSDRTAGFIMLPLLSENGQLSFGAA